MLAWNLAWEEGESVHAGTGGSVPDGTIAEAVVARGR
jgi:hypothetical protein